MKRQLLAACLVLAPLALAQASKDADDGRNALISSETPHDRLYAVLFEKDKGIAVGGAGLVKLTTDGGRTWQRADAPTDLTILDVASNGERTLAVGQMGLILLKVGDGDWKQVASGTEQRLLGVDINRDGLAFIVGAFGTLLRSTDGGQTWASAAPKWETLYESGSGSLAVVRDEPTNYVVDVLDNGGTLIGGEYGQILYSPDGGTCWQIAHRQPADGGQNPPTLFSMSLHADGTGYAAGQSGLVLRTENGGMSWQDLKTGIGASLFAIEATSDGHVVAVGQRAAIRSRDHGRHWESLHALDLSLNWYAGIGRGASADTGEFVAVGHGARIIRLAP